MSLQSLPGLGSGNPRWLTIGSDGWLLNIIVQRSSFLAGPSTDFEPSLDKTGIMFQKIERDDSRQHREEKPKSPRLPEMQGSGGHEKHHRHDALKPDSDFLLSSD